MATPIAHKGVIAGAKVQAMTMLDILLHPELVEERLGLLQQCPDQGYEVQDVFLRPDDKPAIWLNQKTMEQYRDRDEGLVLRSLEVRHLSGTARIKYPDRAVAVSTCF